MRIRNLKRIIAILVNVVIVAGFFMLSGGFQDHKQGNILCMHYGSIGLSHQHLPPNLYLNETNA
jgi:hypothetical protein